MIHIIYSIPLSLHFPSFTLVRIRVPCRLKVSLLAALTVARRKFSFSTDPHRAQVCICSNNYLAARRDSSSLISMRILWRKAKRSSLSITQNPGELAYHPTSPIQTLRLLTRPSSPLIRWHEHDATEIQQVCDRVIEQAISKLEEAGYMRSSVKVIGARHVLFTVISRALKQQSD